MIIFQEYVNGCTPHICKFSDTLRTHSEEVRYEQFRAEATAVEPLTAGRFLAETAVCDFRP